MNITRYFLAQKDEDYGIFGWVPLWIPKAAGFNSFSIEGCMHDMLEHRLCDQGHYHEEVMAFGRMAVLRGLTDTHSGRGLMYSAPESMGLELSGIYLRTQNRALLKAPDTAPTDCVFEEFLSSILKHYRRSGIAECDSYSIGEKEANEIFDSAHIASMRNWLRIGYLDGKRRYGDPDHKAMDIARAAWGWAKSNKHLDSEAEESPGSVLRVIVDTDQCRVRHTLIYPNTEYGMHPKWLRSRIWHWRNDYVKRLPMEITQ
jgi:hypothetical protein